jgi:hypothetical protein
MTDETIALLRALHTAIENDPEAEAELFPYGFFVDNLADIIEDLDTVGIPAA